MSTQTAKTIVARVTPLTLVFISCVAAMACSVPVFRYAIEHWRPDAYRVFVYHDHELTQEDQVLLSRFESEAKAGANVQVQTYDLRESLEPIDKARWDLHSDKSLPQMIVQLPAKIGGGESPVAVSTWNEQEVGNLLSSPKRTEIAQRLVAGEIVWVFLESDNVEESDKLFQLLKTQLDIQQETLELPEIEEADRSELSADPESLAIKFSVVRVSRSDELEKWFVEMLLSIEPDLREAELVNQAMAFPVFGRGRALYALVGDGINPDMIRDAATFLTGACQCTVKAENPGVDLLIPMPWDQVIQVTEPLEVSLPLVGLGGGLPVAKNDETSPLTPQIERPATTEGKSVELADTQSIVDNDMPLDRSDDGRSPQTSDAALAVVEQASTGMGLWIPVLVVLAIGTVVGWLGTSILRR